ncbi:Stage II sporulation protein Q [compost metagenome]
MERGTVEKIYDDSFYGTTVIIDHGQGYKSLYANLDKDVSVKVKQVVKKSDVIGKIGNTAIGEIKDDSHVHVQIFKDGVVIDPSSKF